MIYFASDFHLGTPTAAASRARELRIIAWLEMVRKDATEIFLVRTISNHAIIRSSRALLSAAFGVPK